MNALFRTVGKHKRLLAAVFGSLLAGGAFSYSRRHTQVREYPTPNSDNGPVVAEATLLGRIAGLLPQRRTKPANTGGGGQSTANDGSRPSSTRPVGKTFSEVQAKTPIPKRPEATKETERRQRAKDIEGPDFGPDFGIERR